MQVGEHGGRRKRRGCERETNSLAARLAEVPPHDAAAERVRVDVAGQVVGAGDGDLVGFDDEVRCECCWDDS